MKTQIKSKVQSTRRHVRFALLLVTCVTHSLFVTAQNISINTTGAANSTTSMFEVLQPSTETGTSGIFSRRSGAFAAGGSTAYAFWAEAICTGVTSTNVAGYFTASGATNNYAGIFDQGNVGIGITAPPNKLSVTGNANFSGKVGIGTVSPDDGAKPHKCAIVDDAVPAPWHDDVGQLQIRGASSSAKQLTLGVNTTAATSYAWVNSTLNGTGTRALALNPDGGNVGIGTTAPQNKLDVEGGAVIGATYSGTNASPANGLLVQGNVGIGTTAPTNILSLGGNSAQTIWMERTTTAATAGFGLTLQAGGAIAGTNNLTGGDLTLSSGTSTGTGTSKIHFFTSTAGASGSADGAPTEKMTLMGSGRVGIGTTNPVTWLEIAPPGNSVGEIALTSTSGAGSQIAFGDNAASEGYDGAITWNGSLSNVLEFRAGNNGTGVGGGNTRMMIAGSTGYVGIGTGTSARPNTLLDVNGGVSLRATTNAQITANTNDYAIGSGTTFRLSSDASRNITGLTGGYDGKIIIIRNVGANDIVFVHNAGSAVANRFDMSGGLSITISANHSITFQYDATSAKWYDIAVR